MVAVVRVHSPHCLSMHSHSRVSCNPSVAYRKHKHSCICVYDELVSSQLSQKGQVGNMEIWALGKILFHDLGTSNRVP